MPRYKIPLTSDPQQFSITLGGIDYLVLLTYKNVNEGGWVIDISDKIGNVLVSGIPLVTGTDILSPHGHLGFKGGLSIETSDPSSPVPTFENLGIDTLLIWTTI